MTTLNSVVAVCQLSADLYPAKPASPVLVSTSVGLMNLVGAWFGAMPCCHGAGGLAAQVRAAASIPVLVALPLLPPCCLAWARL